MNTFATGSLPVHFSVAKLFNFRWQYTSDRQKQVLKLNFNYLSTQEKKVRCKVQSEGRFGGHQGARDS